MVLQSISTMNKIGVHELIVEFGGGNGKERVHKITINTYSSPAQVAGILEKLANEIRREEGLK